MLSSTLVCGEMIESIGFGARWFLNLFPIFVFTKIFHIYPKLKHSLVFVYPAMLLTAIVQFALVKYFISDNMSELLVLNASLDAFLTAWFGIFLGNYVYISRR